MANKSSHNKAKKFRQLKSSYDNINDLVRDLGLDRSHWINKESCIFLSKKIYDKTLVETKHVPEELLGITVTCSNGHRFVPEWVTKRYPVAVFYCEERGLLRYSSCEIECEECGDKISFGIPSSGYQGEVDVYGDEASSVVCGNTIFTYSFVSFLGDEKDKNEFERRFHSIKNSLAPSIDPKNWVLHMMEILHKDKRNSIEYLKHNKSEFIINKLKELLKLIREYNLDGKIKIYTAVGVKSGVNLKDKVKKECQSGIYNSALMQIIREFSNSGLSPKFYFERTGDDGWAKNLFKGFRLTLLWAYLTRGLPVKSPVFVTPTESLYLELADVVSYIVNRYVYSIGRESETGVKPPHFDPSLFGDITYILTDEYGDWVVELSEGFPEISTFPLSNSGS